MAVKHALETALAKAPTGTQAESLIEAAVTQIRQLSTSEEALHLFRNGLESLELQLDSSDGAKMSLKLSAAAESATVPASVEDDAHILLEGDVFATFNAEGHRVVAFIGQEDLKTNFPDTMKKVQKILDNGHRSLEDAATFPDDIRFSHPETKPFHFIDIPLRDDGPMTPPLPPAPHIISKIAEFTEALKNGGSAVAMVDALSWLIHLIGDIHQPLHCVTHITSEHPLPGGDRGGNMFKLKGSPNNLHSVWDSSASFHHNLDDQALALSIMQQHSRQKLATELQVTDVEKWARSSFNLAKQFAYGPLLENSASPPKLTAAYLQQAESIGRKQVALAGYRLTRLRLRPTRCIPVSEWHQG